MTGLITEPNFSQAGRRELRAHAPGDAFYEALIEAHQGLDDAQSAMLNVRLILLLANQVGELGVLREALAAARAGV